MIENVEDEWQKDFFSKCDLFVLFLAVESSPGSSRGRRGRERGFSSKRRGSIGPSLIDRIRTHWSCRQRCRACRQTVYTSCRRWSTWAASAHRLESSFSSLFAQNWCDGRTKNSQVDLFSCPWRRMQEMDCQKLLTGCLWKKLTFSKVSALNVFDIYWEA